MRNICIYLVIFCLLVNKSDFDGDLKGLKIPPIFSIIQFKTKMSLKQSKLINQITYKGASLQNKNTSAEKYFIYLFVSKCLVL